MSNGPCAFKPSGHFQLRMNPTNHVQSLSVQLRLMFLGLLRSSTGDSRHANDGLNSGNNTIGSQMCCYIMRQVLGFRCQQLSNDM